MTDPKTLYEGDFVAWTKQQAEALRAAAHGATNRPIDWDNVAEEIDSLDRSEKRELDSQIGRIIETLLKVEFSRATDPRMGWIESIDDARNEIERVLETSPSLRREINAAITAEMKRGLRQAIRELEKYVNLDAAILARICATNYTEDRILDD